MNTEFLLRMNQNNIKKNRTEGSEANGKTQLSFKNTSLVSPQFST